MQIIMIGLIGLNVIACSNNPIRVGAKYQGGVIAYIFTSKDPGYDPDVVHGLIAAEADQSEGTIWCLPENTRVLLETTLTSIGSSLANTDTIVALNGTDADYAAKIARAYMGGGYTDWRLPSRDELHYLFRNQTLVGGFTQGYYWSSSEGSFDTVWIVAFDAGTKIKVDKASELLPVRAVRSF